MMKNHQLLQTMQCLLFLAIFDHVSSVKVSFFGDSHISMPLQEGKLSTNVRLKFRTHQEHAMLLLAAGRTDYCLLNLDGGRVRLQFRVNETLVELWSPARQLFNDRQWHDLSVQRYDTNVTMQIDEHIVRKTLHARLPAAELNIHFGVFLGGPGDYSAEYLSSVDNLRGCISDVFYNNINLLKRAKEGTSHVSSIGVTWTCSDEFDADVDSVIGFVHPEAHVVLAKPSVQTGESWSMEFRTIEPTTTLLYNSGADFVGLELVDGKARLLVGKGSNVVELIGQPDVADGLWHNVSIDFSPQSVLLTIDTHAQQALFANGSSQIIELGEEYAVGGIGVHLRRRALGRKLKAVNHSLLGCVRNLTVDRQPVGFPHFKITGGIEVGCPWRYPCLAGRSPCIASGECLQFGVEDFNCRCDQAFCVRADFAEAYKIFTRSDLLSEIELVAVRPVQVLEAHSEYLTVAHINVLLEYDKWDIAESGVVFSVAQPPKYGRIVKTTASATMAASSFMLTAANDSTATAAAFTEVLDTRNSTGQRFFSLVDLSTDRVKYVHSGNEQFADHVTIDMQLMDDHHHGGDELPNYLQRKHRFVLHVNVTPVNDAPVLVIPANRMLRLTQGIPKLIGSDLLQAEDPDSDPETLMYSIRVAGEAGRPSEARIEVAGTAVTTFSQANVNAGLVTLLMNPQTYETMTFEMAVQVSDGIETSAVVYVPVSVMPLELRLNNNTGLMLVHKSSALITPWNLSFSSNSMEDNVDVKYTIVQAPHFGNIQKFRSVDNSWISVDSFSSDLLQLGHIRYIHNTDFPVQDDFKFIASFGQFNSIKYDFRLTFTKLRIGVQTQNSLLINGTRDTIISTKHLFHQTTPVSTFVRNIIYTVVQSPKYGQIVLNGHGTPSYARVSDSFTQQDIDKNLIVYRTHRTSYSSFVDVFEFTVSVSECEDVRSVIKMVYNPPDELIESMSYQSRTELQLDEGGRAQLTRFSFQVVFNRFDHLTFRVSTKPQHGRLCPALVGQEDDMQTIHSFTLQQLYLNDIYYCHDDTETTTDRIDFLVLSDDQSDFQFVCSVMIAIRPINDNGPARISDTEAVFQLVRNQSRLLTARDLHYTDPDVPSDQTDHIKYSQVAATNGEFYLAGVLTDEFTQTDIEDGRVRFRHWGGEEDNGTVGFVVSDGLFDVSGTIRVSASEPFISIGPRNASIVQEGHHIVLTLVDLAIDTNLDASAADIEYHVIGDPVFGVLRVVDSDWHTSNGSASYRTLSNVTSAKNFTQADIRDRRIVYYNTVVASMDQFRYRVSAKGVEAEGDMLVRVYPSAYWDLLQIRMNQTLYVEESTSVKISRKILEIVHPNISPGDITYLVTTSPQHGYLEIQSITSDDEYNCKVFDQSTINAEKMFYIQAGVNQSNDHFVFDVTNGITWLRGLTLKIVIIPDQMYVLPKNVSVNEGQAVRLEPADLLPYSEYYQGKVLEYKILVQPQFGELQAGTSKVNRFTFKQLESGQVRYVHDDSENETDVIRFMAIARNKESVPFDLWIDINPVNDERPQLVTNTGLHMWIGGTTVIRKGDLMAQDNDTPTTQLTFNINQILGGSLHRLNSSANDPITSFTQSDIDREQIVFVHNPQHQTSEIRFEITDGVHRTTEQTLLVTTNPVSLELIRNNLLHVFPLTRKYLQSEQLMYSCSDVDREVRFHVTVPPTYGRLFMIDDVASEVAEFTQLDVLQKRIMYEHTHAMIELRSNDSFYFNVTSHLATSLTEQIFKIEISVSSGGLLDFLPVPRMNLDEGALAPIHLDLTKVLEYLELRAGIKAPELYIVTSRPQHGNIVLMADGDGHSGQHWESGAETPSNESYNISLHDFNTGRVYYQHDHSNTVTDTILMSVYLTQGQLRLCNLTLPVTVNPVNDDPFVLVTQSPHMTVVEGENRTISRAELLTEDEDTEPAEILYDVISGPTLGALMKLSEEGVAQNIFMYGNQFTQADINAERILYTHFGVAQSTTFYFKVSDGQFKPAYEIFNLRVLPVTLSSGMEREILVVQQGTNQAVIDVKHLPLETNALRSRLVYNVTEAPRGGNILVEDKAATRFGQEQLDGSLVTYMQTDMTRSNDKFRVNVYIPDSNLSSSVQFDVKVIVEPIIKIHGISITSRDKIRLTCSLLLDNPTLSKLNRYNPKIIITRAPDHGRVRKIVRTSGGDATAAEVLTDKDISTFTYKELKSGIVFFVARDMPVEVDSINDYFEYTLQLKSVQPGQGFVPIEIHKTPRADNATITSTNPNTSDSGYGNVNVATSQTMPLNYVVLLGLVAIVMMFGILMAVLIRCRSSRNEKQNCGTPVKGYPPQLPRPPDFMTLNSQSRVMMYASSLESGGCDAIDSLPPTVSSTPLPVLSSIPHCKVIPIDLDDDDDDGDDDAGDCDREMDDDGCSESDVERRQLHDGMGRSYGYGYGNEPDDWSSSCDVTGGDNNEHQEVTYSSINQPHPMAMQQQQLLQKQQKQQNPLLRRNQYWV